MNIYRLVISELKRAPSERRCFRSVGGVLIEQKAAEVAVALEKNYEMVLLIIIILLLLL